MKCQVHESVKEEDDDDDDLEGEIPTLTNPCMYWMLAALSACL